MLTVYIKLMNKFSNQVIDIYDQYIAFESNYAGNRSSYRNVCAIIKRFKKIAGADNTDSELVKHIFAPVSASNVDKAANIQIKMFAALSFMLHDYHHYQY